MLTWTWRRCSVRFSCRTGPAAHRRVGRASLPPRVPKTNATRTASSQALPLAQILTANGIRSDANVSEATLKNARWVHLTNENIAKIAETVARTPSSHDARREQKALDHTSRGRKPLPPVVRPSPPDASGWLRGFVEWARAASRR